MKYRNHIIIGSLLMLPAIGLFVYLLFQPSMWLNAIVSLVTTSMAMVGLNVIKGANVKEAVEDVADDYL